MSHNIRRYPFPQPRHLSEAKSVFSNKSRGTLTKGIVSPRPRRFGMCRNFLRRQRPIVQSHFVQYPRKVSRVVHVVISQNDVAVIMADLAWAFHASHFLTIHVQPHGRAVESPRQMDPSARGEWGFSHEVMTPCAYRDLETRSPMEDSQTKARRFRAAKDPVDYPFVILIREIGSDPALNGQL